MATLTVAATGHRWERLGLPRTATADHALRDLAYAFLSHLQPDACISGLALGWDTAFAEAALRLRIPLTVAIPLDPFRQSAGWRLSDAERYRHIRGEATHQEIVGAGEPFPVACKLRNLWMMERADLVAALWDGQPSGTGHAVANARVPVVNLWGLHLPAGSRAY